MKFAFLSFIAIASLFSSSFALSQRIVFCRVIAGYGNCYYYSMEACTEGGRYYCYVKEE
jgi:hypothetical protein